MQFNDSLFSHNDYLIVAFSGGADSVACLHHLSKVHDLDKLSAFYLHHGLRKEADAEVVFCEKFCKQLGVVFYTDKVDIANLARKQKKSLEEVGRDVRYAKLAETAQKLKAESKAYKLKSNQQINKSTNQQNVSDSEHFKIITAHHLDDQVESVLMQIFSGTSGLRIGIAEQIKINGIDVIRPMLHETKQVILDYCKHNKLKYVTDASNLENDFKRNKLRNIVIPMIRKTMNPNLHKAIERYKSISDDCSAYVDDQLQVIKENLVVVGGYDLLLFKKLHPFFQKEFIKRELADKDVFFTMGLIEEIIEQLKSSKPNIKYSIDADFKLIKEYKIFRITSLEQETFVATELSFGDNHIGDRVISVYLDTMCMVDKRKKTLVCLDADKIELDSLIVRSRQDGDVFVPLGMTGHKKLKDYFIDKKVAMIERDGVLVVEHSGGIIWVVGYEIDDKYKVTEDTKSFLVMEMRRAEG